MNQAEPVTSPPAHNNPFTAFRITDFDGEMYTIQVTNGESVQSITCTPDELSSCAEFSEHVVLESEPPMVFWHISAIERSPEQRDSLWKTARMVAFDRYVWEKAEQSGSSTATSSGDEHDQG